VGTRHGGIPEAILDGQTGFLVDPGHPEQIAGRLAALLQDREGCRRLGLAAQAHVAADFNVERMVVQSEAQLREVLG